MAPSKTNPWLLYTACNGTIGGTLPGRSRSICAKQSWFLGGGWTKIFYIPPKSLGLHDLIWLHHIFQNGLVYAPTSWSSGARCDHWCPMARIFRASGRVVEDTFFLLESGDRGDGIYGIGIGIYWIISSNFGWFFFMVNSSVKKPIPWGGIWKYSHMFFFW